MEPNIQNQPIPQAPPVIDNLPPEPSSKRFKAKYLIDLVVIVALVLAVWAWRNHSRNHDQPHQLSGLSSYTLYGKVAGRGISFEKPAQLTLDTDPEITLLPTEVGFNYLTNDYSAAYIAAESPITSPTYTFYQQNLDLTKKWLNDPNNPAYAGYADVITNFVSSLFPQGAKIHYSVAQNFTNPSIKSNAWVINMDYGNSSTTHHGKAKLVYAIGKNGEYAFIVLAHYSDWSANQTVIDQILNSIKIDQS